jgi:glycosyltransferase involved in cell wall biosynthesis
MSTPDVSVLLVTYNHEKFIAQAIESVLAQRTSFGVELLISEDCSTDRTREIIQEYQRRDPERIRHFLSERNLCDWSVVTRTWMAAKGRYIAMLDGDDYWTSADKLQRQRDYLEEHPEFSACCHNGLMIWDDPGKPMQVYHPEGKRAVLSERDVWLENDILAGSMMHRHDVIQSFPEWYRDAEVYDWPLNMLSAAKGPIKYLAEVMMVYRQHAGGYWSARSVIDCENLAIALLERAGRGFGPAYSALSSAGIVIRRTRIAAACEAEGEPRRAWHVLGRCWREGLRNPHISVRWLIKVTLETKAPRIGRHVQCIYDVLRAMSGRVRGLLGMKRP